MNADRTGGIFLKILLYISIGLLFLCGQSFAYTDIASDHWAYTNVINLTEMGIVSGYPDGSFRPNQEISKAEFLSLLKQSLFPNADVPVVSKVWYDGIYRYFLENELINSYVFQEDMLQKAIKRFEVGEAFIYCFPNARQTYLKKTYTGEDAFSDVIGERERKIATILTKSGIFNGYPDDTVRLRENVTRAEMVCMIANLLSKKSNLENFTSYDESIIYEDGYAISSDLQMYSELQPLQYSKEEGPITTNIERVTWIESLNVIPSEYKWIFEKLDSEIMYYKRRKMFLEENKVLIVEFNTANHSDEYSTLTGADFLNLEFPGRDDIKVIDVFDIDDFVYADKQVPTQSFELMPQSSHKTTAVYVLSDSTDKIRFRRSVNTMYCGEEYINTSFVHSLILYL